MLAKFTIFLAAIAQTACSSKPSSTTHAASANDSGTLSVTAALSPNPPVQGNETITVSVKDPTGNVVRGAHVKIASNMPSMSMAGPSSDAQDNGDGTYTADLKLNYVTKWSFAVSVDAGGKHAVTTIDADLR